MAWKKRSRDKRPVPEVSPRTVPRLQEVAVFLLILGTLGMVGATEGLPVLTVLVCLSVVAIRAGGFTLSTNMGCALLVSVGGAAPLYWFFLRSWGSFSIKDFLLAVLMVFLLSAQSGRDFAAVSSYCVWILMASLFPSSGPQQWFLLGILFGWFLVVQSLNELRRCRELNPDWQGLDGWRLIRPLLGFSLLSVMGIGAIAAGLYLMLPRNPANSFHFNFQPLRRLVGFSNSVRLGEIGDLQQDQTPAFRVRFLRGQAPPLLRWRGAALADFNGNTWMNKLEAWNEFSEAGKIIIASDEQRRRPGERLFYEIQSLAAMDRVILAAGVPEYAYLPEGRLRINGEGGLRQIAADGALPNYSLSVWIGAEPGLEGHALASDANFAMAPLRREQYLRLPSLHPRIRELAETLTMARSDAYQKALAIEDHLRANYGYSLQAGIGSSQPLFDFLFLAKAGHCEYFASAMAVLLRSVGVPSRVVTGFYTALPQPVGDWYVIRGADAHSWVEVWLEGKGWMVFDPTPPGASEERVSEWAQWLRRMEDRMLIYSEDWMGGAAGLRRPSIPELDLDWARLAEYGAALSLVGLLAWFLLRWRPMRGGERHAASLLYERYLAAEGIERQAHQTARELPGQTTEIRLAYERARFSQGGEALRELRRLVQAREAAASR